MEQLPLLRRLSSFGMRHTNPMSPIPHAKPIRTPRKVWLDDLPLELCTRVASCIINFSYRSVVSFSNVSETQRSAMKNAFAGKLDLSYFESATMTSYEYCWDSGEAPTWLETDCVSLIGDEVQEVHLSGSQFFSQSVQDCFKSPALTKLVIRHRPCDFQYLLCMSHLRVLDLSLMRFDGLAPFLKRMSIPILDLQELRLQSERNICLHKHFSDDVHSRRLLASWFPRVEKLSLECGKCLGIEKPRSYLWYAMEKFQELREVAITEAVPDYAIGKLGQMERVALQDGNVFELAERIPDRVVEITTTLPWYKNLNKRKQRGKYFEQIAKCSRLESLKCFIPGGSEHGLVKVAGNLRCLNIGYATDDEDAEKDMPGDDFLNVMTPRSEAVLAAVRSAPYLKCVSISSMPMPARTLCEMLETLGEGLESFDGGIFSSHWRAKDMVYDVEENRQELEDVISVLRTAALHNRSLVKLSVDSNILRLRDGDLIEANIAQQSIFPLLPTFQATVAVLQRRVPRLDAERWKTLLRQFRASCSQKVSFSEESE